MDKGSWKWWLTAAVACLAASFAALRGAMGARVTQGYEHLAPVLEIGSLGLFLAFLTMLVGIPANAPWGKRVGRRLRNAWVSRRISREQARCRAQHGEEIKAWESFYEAASRATHYPHESYHDRLPLDLAWPEFLRQLPRAEQAAHALPDELRVPALAHLRRLSDRAATCGVTPSSSECSAIYEGCNELGLWIDHQRRDRFPRKLYLRCGLQEPYWPDRLETLSADQLRADATPPEGEPSTTAPEPRPPSSPESSE